MLGCTSVVIAGVFEVAEGSIGMLVVGSDVGSESIKIKSLIVFLQVDSFSGKHFKTVGLNA